MKIHLIAFGSPYKKFRHAHIRFFSEAQQFGVFDNTLLFSEKNIFNFCTDLIPHKTFLSTTRGYGYWIWKSFLLGALMEKIPDDDIICYLDIGCTLNPLAKDRFYDYVAHTVESGALCFEIPYKERDWNKMDCYNRIFPDDKSYLHTNQRAGGMFFLKNNNLNRKIILEIKTISTELGYHYLSDAPSILENYHSFKEHRHDQSIFSLISKKYNFYVIKDVPEWSNNWEEIGKKHPIWATRNFQKQKLKFSVHYTYLLNRLNSLINKKPL